MRTCILIGLVLSIYSGRAQAAPPVDIVEILPHDPQNRVNLEAAFFIRDLKRQHEDLQRLRQLLSKTQVGAALFDDPKTSLGIDLVGTVRRLAKVAAPNSAPVPVAAAVFTQQGQPGGQLLMAVEAGFTERLATALKTPAAADWPVQIDDDQITVTFGEYALIGQVDTDGWLRLAPTKQMRKPHDGEKSILSEAVSKQLRGASSALIVRGGGMLSKLLATLGSNSSAGALLQSTRAAAIGYFSDGDRTAATRIIIDTPVLEAFGQSYERSTTAPWQNQAASHLSISLPASMFQIMLSLGSVMVSKHGIDIARDLSALEKLTGRISFANFGHPGDWALTLGLPTVQDGAQLIGQLKAWIPKLGKQFNIDFDDRLVDEHEKLPIGSQPVVHLRPDTALQGIRFIQQNTDVLVVGQRARIAKLFAEPKDEKIETLTPMVEQTLGRPALIRGYTSLSGDGSLFTTLGWLATAASSNLTEETPQPAWVTKFLRRAPAIYAVAGFYWAMLYDAAIWGNIEGSVLVIELLTSEV